MSRCNGYGGHFTTRDRLMAEHDALPAPLRALACNSVAKWSAESFSRLYGHARKGGATHREALAQTAAILAAEERQDTRKTYGPSHPEARA